MIKLCKKVPKPFNKKQSQFSFFGIMIIKGKMLQLKVKHFILTKILKIIPQMKAFFMKA